jgi:hypothetical protein
LKRGGGREGVAVGGRVRGVERGWVQGLNERVVLVGEQGPWFRVKTFESSGKVVIPEGLFHQVLTGF